MIKILLTSYWFEFKKEFIRRLSCLKHNMIPSTLRCIWYGTNALLYCNSVSTTTTAKGVSLIRLHSQRGLFHNMVFLYYSSHCTYIRIDPQREARPDACIFIYEVEAYALEDSNSAIVLSLPLIQFTPLNVDDPQRKTAQHLATFRARRIFYSPSYTLSCCGKLSIDSRQLRVSKHNYFARK